MGSVTSAPGATTIPSKGCGCETPAGVMNVMSTTASVVVGLYNDSVRVLPLIVEPEAKYHSDAVEREHGLSDHPSGPATDSVASTPPPSRLTVVATRFPVASSPGTSTLSERAGTTIATVLVVPVSPTAVSVPATACDVVLTRLTVVVAVDPGAEVPPTQYQADDSTATGATEEIGAGGAATGGDRCSERSATPAPTAATRITLNTATRIRPGRWVAGCARGAASGSATGARSWDPPLI